MENSARSRVTQPGLVIGVLLIAVGLLLILGRLLGLRLAAYLWPFFVIVPGAALLIGGLMIKGAAGQPLTMVGSSVAATGSLLFYQNITGHWQSWSYAWALVAPTALGLGLVIYGTLHGRPKVRKDGTDLATIGLVLFAVFGVFFELILGISGFGFGHIVWPILLILAGVTLLARSILGRRRSAS